MQINGLPLPVKLQELLESGEWVELGKCTRENSNLQKLNAFKKVFSQYKNPSPKFYDWESIKLANQLWDKPEVYVDYLGVKSDSYPPGDVDPSKTIIIGQSQYESPIALDCRTEIPRVVYMSTLKGSPWVEAADSFNTLIHKLKMK